jgi:hypothetical protein
VVFGAVAFKPIFYRSSTLAVGSTKEMIAKSQALKIKALPVIVYGTGNLRRQDL